MCDSHFKTVRPLPFALLLFIRVAHDSQTTDYAYSAKHMLPLPAPAAAVCPPLTSAASRPWGAAQARPAAGAAGAPSA